jgi:hypothetical protein
MLSTRSPNVDANANPCPVHPGKPKLLPAFRSAAKVMNRHLLSQNFPLLRRIENGLRCNHNSQAIPNRSMACERWTRRRRLTL